MRSAIVAFVVAFSGMCLAQDVIVRGPVIVSAQEHTTVIASRGRLIHSRCNRYEGIGCGSTPDEARRNCCYFGQRIIIEEGVAWSPVARRWFAVIRYR